MRIFARRTMGENLQVGSHERYGSVACTRMTRTNSVFFLHLLSEDLIDRMKEGQNDIYYIMGESIAVMSSSPAQIELLEI